MKIEVFSMAAAAAVTPQIQKHQQKSTFSEGLANLIKSPDPKKSQTWRLRFKTSIKYDTFALIMNSLAISWGTISARAWMTHFMISATRATQAAASSKSIFVKKRENTMFLKTFVKHA